MSVSYITAFHPPSFVSVKKGNIFLEREKSASRSDGA